jgi:hypothetical protein
MSFSWFAILSLLFLGIIMFVAAGALGLPIFFIDNLSLFADLNKLFCKTINMAPDNGYIFAGASIGAGLVFWASALVFYLVISSRNNERKQTKFLVWSCCLFFLILPVNVVSSILVYVDSRKDPSKVPAVVEEKEEPKVKAKDKTPEPVEDKKESKGKKEGM